jgi:hypothetical protein
MAQARIERAFLQVLVLLQCSYVLQVWTTHHRAFIHLRISLNVTCAGNIEDF